MREARAGDGNRIALLVQKQNAITLVDAADLMDWGARFFGGFGYFGPRCLRRGKGDLVIVSGSGGAR